MHDDAHALLFSEMKGIGRPLSNNDTGLEQWRHSLVVDIIQAAPWTGVYAEINGSRYNMVSEENNCTSVF